MVSQVFAQATEDSGDQAERGQLQEVVVTAQFREQNLQQTPIAITAVTAEMLEQRNQTDISMVAGQAPNVTLQPNGAAFGSSMVAFIRGVGQTDFNLALEPGVGIYVDDVYYSTLTGSLLDLLDLERVEILRGPQGTLAGKNSIGGAIKLFSKKPTGDGDGYLEATFGTLNRIDARGAADFKLAENFFARASFSSKHHDGYVKRVDYACTHPGSNVPGMNVGDGCELGRDGSQAYTAGRLALRWLANDAVEVNLATDITNDQSGVQANTVIKYAGALGAATYILGTDGVPITYGPQFIPYGPDSQDPNQPNDPYLSYATYHSNASSFVFGENPYAPITVPPINHFKTWGISGDVTWKLSDNMALTSVTAYRNYTNQFAEQTDASPIGVQILLQRQKHHQYSQELRLNGTAAGSALDYTVGAFYLDQDGGLNARVGLPWVGFDFIHGPDSTPAKTKAVFANLEWHATDQLTFGGGARYSDEQKDYTYLRHNADGTDVVDPMGYNGLVAGLNASTATFEGTRTDWRVHLDYQMTPDIMSYIQTSTGYKGGGVNPRPFIPPQTLSFEPETLTAYELGLKTTFFDRRVRLNGAIFFNDYEDIQLTLSACPASPCALPANVGSADVKGAELEAEIHPTDNWEIDASASYLDFEYTEIANPDSNITLDMRTPYTPESKWSVGTQYVFQMGDKGTLTPRIDAAYTGSQFAAAINNRQFNQIESYTVLNARLTWRSTDGDWQTALSVSNVTDELYYLTLFDLSGSAGYVNGQPSMPRQYSISIKHNF
jgi:iron complex outermembrane recepter protein